jgi:hypothetical protein
LNLLEQIPHSSRRSRGITEAAPEFIRGRSASALRKSATHHRALQRWRFKTLPKTSDGDSLSGLRLNQNTTNDNIDSEKLSNRNEMKLARHFAVAGFLISILFCLFWSLDGKFNFFHLPTVESVPPVNYNEPASRALLVKLNLILCPPYVATSLVGMDLGWTANFVLWAISLVLNTALYFLVGWMIGSLWNRLTLFRKAPSS